MFLQFTYIKTFNKIYKKYVSCVNISTDTCQKYICIIFTILVGIKLHKNTYNK